MKEMHPLLKEFFTPRNDYMDSIRIHCATEEDRCGLVELAKSVVDCEFNTSSIDSITQEDADYLYFFWRYGSSWLYGYPKDGFGFDAFSWAHDRTYEFVEFMALVSCAMEDDIEGVGDLL